MQWCLVLLFRMCTLSSLLVCLLLKPSPPPFLTKFPPLHALNITYHSLLVTMFLHYLRGGLLYYGCCMLRCRLSNRKEGGATKKVQKIGQNTPCWDGELRFEGHFILGFFHIRNHHIGFVPQGDKANKISRHTSMCQLSERGFMASTKLWSIYLNILLTEHFHVEVMGAYIESRSALLSNVQVECGCCMTHFAPTHFEWMLHD